MVTDVRCSVLFLLWRAKLLTRAQAMVALDEMYAFYSMIRDRFLAYNGTSFEQDNMGSYSNGWAQVGVP